MFELLTRGLDAAGLGAQEVDGTLNVQKGTGPLSRKVNIDPTETLEWLERRGDETRRQDLASWVNGVLTVMSEPKRSDARNWSFTEAAGSIYPTFEAAGYTYGVRDACGESPWLRPLMGDELFLAWVLRLGRGIRPLTSPHVAQMGVTGDRIEAAGRSLLFHATRHHRFDGGPDVQSLRVGDGHDAARLLVVEDVFFTEVDSAWRFAIPHPDVLLASRGSGGVQALRMEARRRHDAAEYPLDAGIWRTSADGPIRDS